MSELVKSTTINRTGLKYVALLMAYVLSMAIVLQTPLLTGFQLGFGDRGDGIIEISVLEHWNRLFTGSSTGSWRQALYFYPHANTFGYNDGYVLFGMVYSFWRQWFDPFISDTLNVATWKTVGFFASYALVAHGLRWERPLALLVSVLFTIANGMMTQAGHSQLQLVALVPVIGLLLVLLVRAEAGGQRRRAMALAGAAALVLSLWLLTGFYLAWFTLYFALIFTLCWLWQLGPGRWTNALRLMADHAPIVLVFVICFAVSITPFLMVYLPKLGETGGHQMWATRQYLVDLVDIANVGSANYMWGWMFGGAATGELAGMNKEVLWRATEHITGYPPILLGLFLAAFYRALYKPAADFPPIFGTFALALAISWVLTIQLGFLSPWKLVYWLVPGAKGVRVVVRYQLWLMLPLLILAAGVWRAKFIELVRFKPSLAIALSAMLTIEQLTSAPSAQLERDLQLRDFARIPPIPAECPAFYVVSARSYTETFAEPKIQSLYPHNADAMLLANLRGKPTINGYSTFNPPDWQFAYPDAADYDERVANYARVHELKKLCRLDARESQPWRVVRY